MVQYIKQAPLSARVGTGFAQGLADQIPKEIERNRLSSGLKNFEQDHQNLNPMQQLARLSSIPGITPQMISSFADLARIGGYGTAMQNLAAGGEPSRGAPVAENLSNRTPEAKTQLSPQDKALISSGIMQGGQGVQIPFMPQTVNSALSARNPYSPVAQPQPPFSPQQKAASIASLMRQGFTPEQAQAIQAQQEQAAREVPSVEQQRQSLIGSGENEASKELNRQLEKRLQKSGEGTFRDIVGDMQLDLETRMLDELKKNPNADVRELASQISKDALNFARVKTNIQNLISTTGIESLSRSDALDKLKYASEIYRKAGRSQELYDLLRTKPSGGVMGMGMSPQGAALIAYPPTKPIQEVINSYKPPQGYYNRLLGEYDTLGYDMERDAREFAKKIEPILSKDDSLLSIAQGISAKNPNFDQNAFFNQLREDSEEMNFSPRVQEELVTGEENWIKSWGDFLLLFFKGNKK